MSDLIISERRDILLCLHTSQLRLTGSPRWRYISALKKGDLKFLSIVRRALRIGCNVFYAPDRTLH